MESPHYINVLAILNEMLHRLSYSLPQIQQATRGLANAEGLTDSRLGEALGNANA